MRDRIYQRLCLVADRTTRTFDSRSSYQQSWVYGLDWLITKLFWRGWDADHPRGCSR